MKCSDTVYNGSPWEWWTLGVADRGSGGPWEWLTLGVADPGSGGPWEWWSLGVADPGSSKSWEWRTLGVADPNRVVGPYHRKRSSPSGQTLYEDQTHGLLFLTMRPLFHLWSAKRMKGSSVQLNSIHHMFFVIYSHQRPNDHTNSGPGHMIMFSLSRMLKTLSRATYTSSR